MLASTASSAGQPTSTPTALATVSSGDGNEREANTKLPTATLTTPTSPSVAFEGVTSGWSTTGSDCGPGSRGATRTATA